MLAASLTCVRTNDSHVYVHFNHFGTVSVANIDSFLLNLATFSANAAILPLEFFWYRVYSCLFLKIIKPASKTRKTNPFTI